jgi:hypothetical protein
MCKHLVIVFVSKVHKFDVEFFRIDNQSLPGKFISPCLEDLWKLRQQIIHLVFKYFNVFVQINLD